jgi:hypothetical protein
MVGSAQHLRADGVHIRHSERSLSAAAAAAAAHVVIATLNLGFLWHSAIFHLPRRGTCVSSVDTIVHVAYTPPHVYMRISACRRLF